MPTLPKQTITANINAEILDNSRMLVSPYDVRHNLIDMIDSTHLFLNGKDIQSANFSTPLTRTTIAGDGALDFLYLPEYVSLDNSAFGYYSLRHNFNGGENTAIGSYSETCNVYGSGNTAVGYKSLAGNTFGNSNTVIGANTLQSNKFGSNNIAIGNGAGFYHGSGIGEKYSNKFYLGINNVSALAECPDISEGGGATPLMYGELDNIRLGIGTKGLHSSSTLEVSGSISPSLSGMYDLGKEAFGWKTAWLSHSINDDIYFSGEKLGIGTASPSGSYGLVTVAGGIVPDESDKYSLGVPDLKWQGHFSDLTADSFTALTFHAIESCVYECKTLYLASSGVCEGEPTPCGYLDDQSADGAGLVLVASGTSPETYRRRYEWLFSPSGSAPDNCLEDHNVHSQSSWNSNISINIASGNHIQTDRVIGRETVSLMAESGCFGFFLRPDNEVVIAGGTTTRNEKQLVQHGANGGTFTLTYSGQTTAAIAWDASASAVETALELLSNIDNVSVASATVSGYTAWTVEFLGSLAGTDVGQLVIGDTLLTLGGSASSAGQKFYTFLRSITKGDYLGAGCTTTHNYPDDFNEGQFRIEHGTAGESFYFEFQTNTPLLAGGNVRTTDLLDTSTRLEVAEAITYAIQNGRKADGVNDPNRAIPDFICCCHAMVGNPLDHSAMWNPALKLNDPTFGYSVLFFNTGHFSHDTPIHNLRSSNSNHAIGGGHASAQYPPIPDHRGASLVSWPAPVCTGGYKPGIQAVFDQKNNDRTVVVLKVDINSSDTAAEVQAKFDAEIGAGKIVVTSGPYSYLKGDDVPAGSAYDRYRRDDSKGELWPDEQRRDCFAITGLMFEYLDAAVTVGEETFNLKELTNAPNCYAKESRVEEVQSYQSRSDITPVIEIPTQRAQHTGAHLAGLMYVLNYSGTPAINASVTTTQQGSTDVTTAESFGEANATYLSREEFIKPNPLSPEGKIHNISDVNFLSSGTDYTVSYSALMSGVTVGQKFISRTSNKKKTDDKEHFYGFDINYKDKLDVVDSHNQKTDRLDISVYDDMTAPVNAFTVMRDYKGAGLVGITNMVTNPLPNTIFNVQSTGNAVARVTGGDGTYSRLQLLSGSNYIDSADGLEVEYAANAGKISLYKDGTKNVAISIDPSRQVGIDLDVPNAKLAVRGDISMQEFDQGRAASNTSSFGKLFVTASDIDGECQKLIFQDECGNQKDLGLNSRDSKLSSTLFGDQNGNQFAGFLSPLSRSVADLTDNFRNITYGASGLKNLTSGDDNIAVGYRAGTNVSQGGKNILIGNLAGEGLTTGMGNVIIGHNVGDDEISSNISNSILIGRDNLGRNATTDYSLYIGAGHNYTILKGIMGPNPSDKYLEVPDGKFMVTGGSDNMTIKHSNNFFGSDKVASIFNKNDIYSNNPDGGVAFTFTGADGNEKTLMTMRHHVDAMTTLPTFAVASIERPAISVSGDINILGGIRFSDGTSVTLESNQMNLGGSIKADSTNKRVSIGNGTFTPTATLEVLPNTASERVQEWKNQSGDVVAWLDQNGNMHVMGSYNQF
jgi:hypothetical protein